MLYDIYYAPEDVEAMLQRIMRDRDEKIKKYGIKNYQRYMQDNKSKYRENNRFWENSYLVRKEP